MAISRFTASGITTGNKKFASFDTGYPTIMAAPTASDGGTGTTASIAFTAQTGATSYTAISSPGSLTGTGASSPVTVSGLTTGTAYTFQIRANNSVGSGPYSAASNSVTPVVPSGFDSIATASPSGSTNVITFSSLGSSTYKHLQIRGMFFGTSAGGSVELTFNGIGGTSYARQYIRCTSSSVSSSGVINTSIAANMFPNGLSTTIPSAAIIDILDAFSTTKYKTVRTYEGQDTNSSGMLVLGSGLFLSTSAISSITLTLSSGNFATTSSVALYGIKGT